MNPDNQAGQPPVQPAQPPQPSQPEKPISYDFITNPPKPPKKSLFSGGGKRGILIILAGGIGLFAVILLLGSIFFSGDPGRDALLNVARKQSKIIAVSTMGVEDSGTNQTKGLAVAVQLTLISEQRDIIAQIYKGGKVKSKEYTTGAGTDITAQLENAQKNGRFDEVFTNIINEELTEYQRELKTANSIVVSPKTKELLSKDFESAGLLLSIPAN